MLGYAEARRRKTKSTDAKPRAESSLLGYAEARRRKTKSTGAKPRAESSLLGYAEARRRKTKSTGVMPGDMSFSQWPRREGGRQSQPTDNNWTYGESQHERYCQIWENGLNKDVKTE